MRIPPDNGANTKLTRRRDRMPQPDRAADQRLAGSPRGGHEGSGDEEPPAGSTAGGSWYGSTADGAAGKGPVRGYPPTPGQPPPMYPPGPFAAWNRGGAGVPGPRPGQPGPGGHQAQAGWQSARTAAGGPALGSGYYGRDDGPEAEPGYSMLAVSDPAADVTSTQTWQAVGDGRATGIWTAPATPGAGASGPQVRPADLEGVAAPASQAPQPADERSPSRAPRLPSAAVTGGGARAVQPGDARRPPRSHSGAHTGPPPVQRPARKRPASVKIAVTAALLLVLAAVAALSYAVLHNPAKPRPAVASPAVGKPSPAPSPSPTLGPYGDIGSRKADPVPLTAAQLYPASYHAAGATVTRTASGKSGNCASDVDGARIQSAVGAAGCDQVVRATYLSSGQGVMGTIGVFNLSTASGAKKAAKSAGASDFVKQLAAAHGKTSKIGQGTGIEEAAAKGHYLILIWAQFADLHKPKNASQRAQIEQFMTGLLDNTANVSLANRMLTGTP